MTEKTDIPPAKKALRAHAIAVRRQAMMESGARAAELLAGHASRLGIASGSVVGGYWPMGDEIDPRPLMENLAELGCRSALPAVTAPGQPLSFRAWQPGDVLEPGLHGTMHPSALAPELVPSVLLVPVLAFDGLGFRLGYGGGYYDRTLERLKARAHVRAIGIAFAAQEVAAIPREAHDQRLDMVATEDRLIVPETR